MLSGCAPGGFRVAENYRLAQQIEPYGSDFNRHLHARYLALATNKRQALAWRDSAHFADKALLAAREEQVGPEPVHARRLDPITAAELSRARRHLVIALENDAGLKMPLEAARAQANFDCWVREQEVDRRIDDILTCRNDFYVALSQVQYDLGLPVALGPAKPDSGYFVYFGFDSVKLSDEAVATVKAAASSLAAGDARSVVIGGHADRAGTEAYSEDLSQRRVQAVRELLLSAGVKARQIEVAPYGAKLPRMATPDNTAASEDRLVEINLVK